MLNEKKPKIRLLMQNPASLGFGGGHVQAIMYKKYVGQMGFDIDFINFSDPKDDFDILHILGMQGGSCVNGINAKKRGKKIVLSSIFYTEGNVLAYSFVNRIMNNRLLRFMQNRFFLMQSLIGISDSVLPNSQAEANQLKNIFQLNFTKTKVIWNGVEPKLFEGVDANLFLTKFNLKPGFVLSVANINTRKNTLNLIRAFVDANIDTKLVLVGNYNQEADPEYCTNVKKLINENKEKILHLENLHYGDELLLSAYLSAKVHILASVLETPGLASLEAGLAGCNLVVGDCLPVREYFRNNVFYCNHEDVSDIKNKLVTAFQAPGRNLNGISSFIEREYSWINIARQLIDVYQSL